MTNRLGSARSDYLLAHAEQPVDWWEWGDEPFAEALERGVPVLVSVGYATCHWCHVMARESFSDPRVAARLTEGFVSIKVDREELPDVDDALMAAASAFTRSLGWPLTVFLTPEGLPFFAGSYFPPTARRGMPGFGDVLDAVEEAWRERPDGASETGRRVQLALRGSVERAEADRATLERALASIRDAEDPEHGGLGTSQKFPHGPVIVALARSGIDVALAGRLLDAVAGDDAVVEAGGLSHLRGRDGGCFRYATRRDWSEPHFERMLVDQAQLLLAATLLGRESPATGIVDFLAAVLRRQGGAFAIAEDAESIVDGELVEGGWHLAPGRERPAVDRLVVTAANGLAIEALAVRGMRDRDERALAMAVAAADWIVEHHCADGVLLHASLDGRASAAHATAQDAGCLASGLLALARATGDERHAVVAREILDAAEDPVSTTSTGPSLALGPASDGVVPGGPAALAAALLDLAELTGDDDARITAQRMLDPTAALTMPVAGASTIAAALRLETPPRTVVLVGEPPDRHRRRSGALVVPVDRVQRWVDAGLALLEGKQQEGAYACEGLTCRLREDW